MDKSMEFLRKPFTFFSHGLKKRGMSEIVATVLTIFVVIVGITVIWVVVLPMIQNGTLFFQNGAEVSIVIDKGYTVFDISKQVASVQVKRGTDEVELARLNIIFDVDGASKTFETESAPNTNGAKTFWFNFSEHDDLMGETPTYVSVVPVYLRNGQEILGDVADRVEIPLGTILLEDEELTKIFSVSGGVPYRKNDTIDVVPVTASVIEIDSCDFDFEEGESYRLNQSISTTGTCFNIEADNVTLDLGGFEISGDGSGYGVTADGYNETTIINGDIYDFDTGIKLENNQNNNIISITANSNFFGIYLDTSSNNILTSIIANDNYDGIYLDTSSNNNQLTSIIANDNDEGGIDLDTSSNNTLIDITANDNGDMTFQDIGYGIDIETSSNNILTDITANNNTYGISLYKSSNNILTDITASSNRIFGNDAGISLYSSSNNILTDITANYNDDVGISLYYGSNNTLTDITANSNDIGISTVYNSNNTFTNANIWKCLKECIYLDESDYNVFDNFIINLSEGHGVRIRSYGSGDHSSHNMFKNANMINIAGTSVFMSNFSGSTNLNNTFLNSSYNNEDVDSNSELIRKWYYRAYVSNMGGTPISGANVTAYNEADDYQFNLTTDSSGYTPITTVIDYVNNGGVKNYYSPYTMLGQKESYPNAPIEYDVTLNENNFEHHIDLAFPL